MIRYMVATMLLGLVACPSYAHFVFVVPGQNAKTVQVVFSDDLQPDENVDIAKIAGIKLTARYADGKDVAVESKAEKHHLSADIKQADPILVYGSIQYGVSGRKDAKPALLIYHPKTALNGKDVKAVTIGEKAALEVVPETEAGKIRFRLLAQGKPVAESEGSVLLPDGKKEKVKTDKEGYTQSFDANGRYAVWLRFIETKSGELGDKKYEEIKHYATLVTDHVKK